MRVLQRAGMRAHGCGFAHALYRVRVSCAMQKRLKVIHACILQQRSASVSIQLRTRMIHPCSLWVATSARGKVCGRGACWRGGKRTHCRCSSGERNHYRWSTANSCKGWSPTRRDRDTHLLAQRPLVASSIDSSLPDPPIRNRFGRGRLAQRLRLEAYPLPARSDRCAPDCVGGGKATLGVRVCGRGANERIQERAERQASTNQTLSAAGTGSVYRPQDPPT
jgi:hypothetical protein